MGEARSARVESVLVRLRDPVISPLIEVEFASAVGRLVRNRQLSADLGRRALAAFGEDRDSGAYGRVAIEPGHFELARRWLETLELALSSLDALHLAIAHARTATLVTADRQLARAAKRVHLKVRLIR